MRFLTAFLLLLASNTFAESWKIDPVWHDGLVEKATYAATRTIYGKPRSYTAIIFTNKEQHDLKTLTKAASGSSGTVVEVFKHNHVEVVPTPNYDYKFETTSHLTVEKLELTRLDAASQEFCGTSFKQFFRQPGDSKIDYWSFSYMPESGRITANIPTDARTIVPQDALPLWLRDYDFKSRRPAQFWLLPTQKGNQATPHEPVPAQVRYTEADSNAHVLTVFTFPNDSKKWKQPPGPPLGTFWMAKDRLHVMTRYQGADGQKYELQRVERVNYWTIKGE